MPIWLSRLRRKAAHRIRSRRATPVHAVEVTTAIGVVVALLVHVALRRSEHLHDTGRLDRWTPSEASAFAEPGGRGGGASPLLAVMTRGSSTVPLAIMLLTALQSIYLTGRRRSEAMLRSSESRLRQIIDLVPHMIFARDHKGRYLLANQAVADAYGTTVENLLHRAHHQVHEDRPELDQMLSADRRVLETAETVFVPAQRFTDSEGGHRMLEVTKIPFTASGFDTPAVLGVAVDTTERRRIDEALHEERERALTTLHSIGDGVVTTDVSGRVEYLNPIAEARTGWRLAEAKGRDACDVVQVVDEQDLESLECPIENCLASHARIELPEDALLAHRDGSTCAVQSSTTPIRSRSGEVVGAVLVFSDVSERRRMTRQMAHQASHDALTGLVNRFELERRLDAAVVRARAGESILALCYLDLDQFKIVNDTSGHVAGDQLLQQVAGLLSCNVRGDDTLARLGGDEFCLLLEGCSAENAVARSEGIIQDLGRHRFSWGGREFDVGVSIGVVEITSETESSTEALSRADAACYAAKDLGRNRVVTFALGDALPTQYTEMLQAVELTDALREGRLRLFSQPILPLARCNETVAHQEILLRVVDPNGGYRSPGTLIAAAERFGLMTAIDRWVFEETLAAYAPWCRQEPSLRIGINLSSNSLADRSLLEFVVARLEAHAVPGRAICFEITETAAIAHLDQAVRLMRALKLHGCRFALDDFGSGQASFRYLKELPVDYLKIDGSFVRNMAESRVDDAMVAAINQMGHSMGIQTIAEWAESETVVRRLDELGVDFAQGYALGRPVPIDDSGPPGSTRLRAVS